MRPHAVAHTISALLGSTPGSKPWLQWIKDFEKRFVSDAYDGGERFRRARLKLFPSVALSGCFSKTACIAISIESFFGQKWQGTPRDNESE